ncbi:hypothetical protein vBCtySFA88_00019 [Clostridium phage vB_CtyS-FA88]|nr:hypothetical protein vBCtySFA88_00019 [Clostridium phage vB_CtyS-FA88]
MYFILAQPAIPRFKWELDVCLNNLKTLGVTNIILLFTKYNATVPKYFEDKYNAQCFVYPDDDTSKKYIPSVKPYLFWQFLKHNPQYENEDFFYMDSDVIFRELPNFSKFIKNDKIWYGSDCTGYLGTEYIDGKGKDLVTKMSNLVGVNETDIRKYCKVAPGAQWLIRKPQAKYWHKVYIDCIILYRFFCKNEPIYIDAHGLGYTPIQKWTAEMWAQLYNMPLFGIMPMISNELEFCWATDDIKRWYETKIYHNAGVTSDMRDHLFFKGAYVRESPIGKNFNWVNKNKCSCKYVQAMLKLSCE